MYAVVFARWTDEVHESAQLSRTLLVCVQESTHSLLGLGLLSGDRLMALETCGEGVGAALFPSTPGPATHTIFWSN